MKIYSKEYHLLSIAFIFLIIGNACQSDVPDEIGVLYDNLPETVDFDFHVKPILSDKCFVCHGPDEEARKADLRLDLQDEAFNALDSGDGKAFKKGHAMGSISIKRMLSTDPDEIMPPPESNLSMSQDEIAMISKWIDQGAKWKDHWAFSKPVKPAIPLDMTDQWTRPNEIDYFIFQKIKQSGLIASDPANKERLLRRVYLDLTGLPPTVQQLDEFLADDSEDAYEQVVDFLLSTNANAERLTMEWLDVSRYADSHGLHADGWRSMWPWRDWVIDAFKNNKPYDEFVTEQIAGDLLENPTKEQIIATAFNRNHTMTAEGGAIDEEWRLSYVFDRAETFSTAFLGLTMNCAKCHDHKYDPISHDEYYQLTAFFNNVREIGMTGDDGNYGPTILLTDDATDELLQNLEEKIVAKEEELSTVEGDVASIEKYIASLKTGDDPEGLVGHFPLDTKQETKDKDGRTQYTFDGNTKITTRGNAEIVTGKYGQAVKFDTDYSELYIQDLGVVEAMDPFSFSVWINTHQKDKKKTQYIVGNSSEKNTFWRGWEIELDGENKVSAQLIHSKPHNLIHVKSEQEILLNEWTHVGLTYDGSSKAEGMTIYINGVQAESSIVFDNLYKSTHTIAGGAHAKRNAPLRLGKSGRQFTGENGLFVGAIDDVKFFERELTPLEMKVSARLEANYTEAELSELARIHNPKYQGTLNDIRTLREKQLSLRDTLKELMVMEESDMKRKTFVYHRGEYTQALHEVEADTPTAINDFPEHLPKDRLGLAHWLFLENNPLTARVTVNRYWQMIFGRGLVKTPQDFGLQGAKPSHPELLDYLALEFIVNEWDLKWLLKKMVMSATYRQNSKGETEHYDIDPENILLARGPSYRLQAEMIRDNALFASGLMNEAVGGESVRPYQPEGLWIEKNSFSHKLLNYKETKGDSLYRRSMYTFIKRTSPHPMMTTFDAPNREVCIVVREQTNTPLQSLVLMNDPQFVEAAKALSQRMQLEGGDSLDEQLKFAFRTATSRYPKPDELVLLNELYQEQYNRFSKKRKEAEELLSVGEMKIANELEPIATASLAMVANAIFNHDESYTKR
jgi:hypothetical protein